MTVLGVASIPLVVGGLVFLGATIRVAEDRPITRQQLSAVALGAAFSTILLGFGVWVGS